MSHPPRNNNRHNYASGSDSLDRNYNVINFGQGKGHLVLDADLLRQVEEQVVQKSRVKLYNGNKYYKTLEDGDLQTLRSLPHMVTFSLNKRPGYLYLFKYRGRPTCMYIRESADDSRGNRGGNRGGDRGGDRGGNRRGDRAWDYILVKHRFNEQLYNGTLFQGEFAQINKFQHLFLINDLLILRGRAHLRDLPEKIRVMQEIFRDQFTPDPGLDTHQLLLKEYCDYRQIEDFVTTYRATLPYQAQITGLVFRPHVRNQKSIIVVLNRRGFHQNLPDFEKFTTSLSRSPVSSSGSSGSSRSPVSSGSSGKSPESALKGLVKQSTMETGESKEPSHPIIRTVRKPGRPKIDATAHPLVRFRMVCTNKPDVYELWLQDCDKKYGIASVPTLALSQKVKSWFDADGTKELTIEAEYVKTFNKWRPVRPVEGLPESILTLTTTKK